ncbi:HEPN domain-containing protein [Acinetobacter seifertii]|nr:HEPN domain-containing protein [Acinetobacter seifertii]QNX68164.1 hypothetical protein IC778_18275 [Acinetobacter seifertii]
MYNPQLIENIILKILNCKEKIKIIKEYETQILRESYKDKNYILRYNISDVHYFFSLEALEQWEKLTIQISEKVFKNQFSLTYINNGLKYYFHKNYNNYTNQNLIDFLSNLKNNASDLLFYIPLYGINLKNKELNIGSFSLKTIEKIKEEIKEISPNSDFKFMFSPTIISDQVLLINNYQTDNDKALEITLNQTNRFIDILNWKFSQLIQPNNDIKYIISLHPPIDENLIYFSLNNKKTISTNFKNLSSTLPLDLNSIEKFICNDEVVWLVRLISEKEINDFYDAILKSIHWFSQFWLEKQNDNQLLYLAISLEALLSESFSTSSFIADRVAFILGNDKSTRLELRDLTKKLYDLRSNIAHGNNINIVQKNDLKK